MKNHWKFSLWPFAAVCQTYFAFSQVWFPTVQDVLQADWHDVWHSPHPPVLIDSFSFLVLRVLMCFIFCLLLSKESFFLRFLIEIYFLLYNKFPFFTILAYFHLFFSKYLNLLFHFIFFQNIYFSLIFQNLRESFSFPLAFLLF